MVLVRPLAPSLVQKDPQTSMLLCFGPVAAQVLGPSDSLVLATPAE